MLYFLTVLVYTKTTIHLSVGSVACGGYLTRPPLRVEVNTEFKMYDATVAKTSFKIASSGFLIFFVIMSVCLTSKN